MKEKIVTPVEKNLTTNFDTNEEKKKICLLLIH